MCRGKRVQRETGLDLKCSVVYSTKGEEKAMKLFLETTENSNQELMPIDQSICKVYK